MIDPNSSRSHPQPWIDLDEPYAVKAWCNKFSCTELELFTAVANVGRRPDNVDAYLKGERSAGTKH